MIPIVVYVGGNVITGLADIDYDNHHRFSFLENEDTYFDEIRTMIYKQLRLPEISNRIILERQLIRRGRRKYICLPMVMDEIEGRWVKRGSRLTSNNNNSDNILVCK
jgi:hypothetical protein